MINRVMVINKNSTIKEILSAYPEAKKFFNEREMACSSCFAVNFDTLEKGALMHGLDAKTLVDELKNFLKTFPTPIAFLQQK
ncbi:MAG: hybrid cluster-associated redox disulfide protein [Nitrospinales bacterium]